MDGVTIVTKAALARAIGRSAGRVSQFINEGKLCPPALLQDGRIDLAAALAQLEPFLGSQDTVPDSRRPTIPAPPSPMAVAKIRLAEAAAAKAEHDLEAARGNQAREMAAISVAVARHLADTIVLLLEERRDGLVMAIRESPDHFHARAVAKEADLQFRRDIKGAVEKEGMKLGAWDSPQEFQAALRQAESTWAGG